MHDRLFERQKNLGVDDLKRHATELALNPESFSACLDSGRYTERSGTTNRTASAWGSLPLQPRSSTDAWSPALWRSASSFRWSRRSWRESARDNRQLLQAVKRLDDNVTDPRAPDLQYHGDSALRSPQPYSCRPAAATCRAGQRPPTPITLPACGPRPLFLFPTVPLPLPCPSAEAVSELAPKCPFTSKTTPLREPSAALRPTARLNDRIYNTNSINGCCTMRLWNSSAAAVRLRRPCTTGFGTASGASQSSRERAWLTATPATE